MLHVWRYCAGILLSALFLSSVPAAWGLTVRVESTGGAPRIVVNGKPVPARMFWGAQASASLALTPQWQEKTFEFIASGNATNGTMHFRFGHMPGDVYLDEIHVSDLDAGNDLLPRCEFEAGHESFTRDWTYWPTGAANTVGTAEVLPSLGAEGSAGLRVRLVSPPEGNWPDYHIYHQPRLRIVAGHRYRVSFLARAEPARPITVAFYRPGDQYAYLGGPEGPFISQIKLAAEAGVNFVSCPVSMPWPAPGEVADYSAAEAQCQAVLQANPNALLLPRISVDAPAWWRRAHPNDVMQWEDGRRDHFVVASARYRQDAAAQLAALVKHLEQKFGESIAGYHPAGQNTGEWFYQDTWKRPLSGYAPADVDAWRNWLLKRYGSDAALQAAWKDASVRLATAAVPAPQARHAAPSGLLRLPGAEQPLIDFAGYQQEEMADCIRELAKAVRTATRGQKLVVFFYGYVFEFGAVGDGPAIAGHYALRRVLDCPDIDVLCAPISYFDRGIGGSAPCMTAGESVALAGKMWLNEDDTHTYLASEKFPGHEAHVTSLAATNQLLRRNVAQNSLRNMGTWWMDLGSSGWFNDAGMWDEMARLRPVDEEMLSSTAAFRPEIAAVIDEHSMRYVAAGGSAITRPGIYESRQALGRMGAPYGQYLLDDVLAGAVRAKVYVMLNAWCLSLEQREKLRAATRGATVLWCYAPGYIDGQGASPEAMRELTGFKVRSVSPERAWAEPSEAGRRLGIQRAWGVKAKIHPLFAIEAQANETLATYPDGSVAAAMRRGPDGISIFVGAPGLTSDLLRLATREGRAHLYVESDCNVYANGPFLVLHASQDGPVEIDTGRSEQVIDWLTNQSLGQGPRLTLPLSKGETCVLRYR